MQASISNVRALTQGEYDFKGPKGEIYRYLDLYDREQGKVTRISLGADCVCPAVPDEGVSVNLWVELLPTEKIVRGEERDRSIGFLKLRAVNVELAKVSARPVAAAA